MDAQDYCICWSSSWRFRWPKLAWKCKGNAKKLDREVRRGWDGIFCSWQWWKGKRYKDYNFYYQAWYHLWGDVILLILVFVACISWISCIGYNYRASSFIMIVPRLGFILIICLFAALSCGTRAYFVAIIGINGPEKKCTWLCGRCVWLMLHFFPYLHQSICWQMHVMLQLLPIYIFLIGELD